MNTSSVCATATGGWVLPSVLLFAGVLSSSSRPRRLPANISTAVHAGKDATQKQYMLALICAISAYNLSWREARAGASAQAGAQTPASVQ